MFLLFSGIRTIKGGGIIAVVFINSNIYEATSVRDVCYRVVFV